MKKMFLLVLSFVLATTLYAQKDVTKFLGIPVDGTKEEMIQKLKAKGFRSSSYDKDVLEGEFNGQDVNLTIVTNNNKVYRILVCDTNGLSVGDIRIRFNRLCQQFKNNSKYISMDDYTISEDEDIRYEMTVHNKRYQASFYQASNLSEREDLASAVTSKYGEEVLNNPMKMAEIMLEDMEIFTMFNKVVINSMNKSVWFMITESFGKYYIAMYYDNKYNEADGEDL